MKTILFACVHNAGRSQIAAAFFNKYSDRQKARALSAGTQPADRIHPEVVTAMEELQIDLSEKKPMLLTSELTENADLLITMGCGEKCPFVPGLKTDDWPLPDPNGKGLDEVKQIRDRIREMVLDLIAENRWCEAETKVE